PSPAVTGFEMAIAGIDTSREPEAADRRGNTIMVTGGLITLSGRGADIALNIPVALEEGAVLAYFKDAAGIVFKDNRLEIPPSSVISGQGSMLQIVDNFGDLGTTFIIETENALGTGDGAVAGVISIKAKSGFSVRDFASVNHGQGTVASAICLDIKTLPEMARVKITTLLEADLETVTAFRAAAASAGPEDISIAYIINIESTNLDNTTHLNCADITMGVSRTWVESRGGAGAVRIFRYDPQAGNRQVLETIFLGYDENGRALFEGHSSDGLSMFGLIGTTEKSIFQWWIIVLALIVAVFLIAAVWFFVIMRKRRKGKKGINHAPSP
ncbi:MAG: hypothetical protein JXA46_14425, partial [Dehalococcoidales bacterium]|nr:hypothetical protein [Dehalococcoidales bacterium]